MVMSGENSLVEREEETTKTEEEEQDSAKVSDKEKDLAAEASSAYNTGDYKGCMLALEKLEVRNNIIYNSIHCYNDQLDKNDIRYIDT